MLDEPLFVSAQDAVKFAVTFNHGIVPRSSMLQIADPSTGHGRGLSGLDGAGQAGMILSEVSLLPTLLQQTAPLARLMPHYTECNCGAACCSKKRVHWTWMELITQAVTELDRIQEENRTPGVRGQELQPRLRIALVCRFFGEPSTLEDIARACEVSTQMVTAHRKFVNSHLKREEHRAWEALDNRLRDLGVVGSL